MRSLVIAAVAVSTLTGLPVSSSPAVARDYPYCLQGRQQGYPGDCAFTSFQQCKATASGTTADCGLNPRFAFGATQPYGGRHFDSRAQW